MIVEVDPAVAREVAGLVGERADDSMAHHDDISTLIDDAKLDLYGTESLTQLSIIVERCEAMSELIRRYADQMEAADGQFAGLILGANVALMAAWARFVAAMQHPDARRGAVRPRGGDLGGTFAAQARPPWYLLGADPEARGINLLLRAMGDLGDRGIIAADEFEIVEVSDGRYIVVLPGVIDLGWPPEIGYNPESMSVRDVDQGGLLSASGTDLRHNVYARYVREALARHVPDGAELMFVGHSYGADTALDLAADADFNGGRYTVTHVMGAGYDTDPQLGSVPGSTRVLSLQNYQDVPVIVEDAGHGVVQAGVRGSEFYTELFSGDLRGAGSAYVDYWSGLGHTASGVGDYVAETFTDGAGVVGNYAFGQLTGGRFEDPFDPNFADNHLLDPGTTIDGLHTKVIFEGGSEGAGHSGSNYIAYLDGVGDDINAVDHAAIRDFAASIDAAGYTAGGSAVTVDVSYSEAYP